MARASPALQDMLLALDGRGRVVVRAVELVAPKLGEYYGEIEEQPLHLRGLAVLRDVRQRLVLHGTPFCG